jgi:hypothetical protein
MKITQLININCAYFDSFNVNENYPIDKYQLRIFLISLTSLRMTLMIDINWNMHNEYFDSSNVNENDWNDRYQLEYA